MESKKINQLATELAPDLSDLTIIGDPTTGISKKITLSQMASLFTGTVEEYATLAAFPLVGVADTIYIALDTNILYRWNTGTSAYVELSPNIVSSLVFNDANGFDGTINLVGSVATLTITTALTTGSVGFIGSSGALLQDNANFFWDDTNNRLGLGTNAPTTAFDVFGSGIIGRINGTSTNNAYLGFSSAGTNKWSVGNVQSDHRFRIFSEANSAELISVLQTGEFGIGIANPLTKLHIDGGATALIANLDANVSVAKTLSFRSDNSNRINLEVSGTESGSNAGANFFIKRYSDAGSLIDTPLTITRSTGAISLATALSGTSATFSDTLNVNYVTPILRLTDSAATGNNGNVTLVAAKVGVGYNNLNYIAYEHIFKGGGSETTFLTINSAGNVGISTSSPNIGGYGSNGRVLTIQGVSGSYGILELTSNSANADGSAIGRLDFGSDGQAAGYKAISSIASFLSGSTSTKFGADLRFYTRANNAASGDPTERMRLSAGGNFFVGTLSDRELFNLGGNTALINSNTYSTSLSRSIIYYSSTISFGLQPIANINFLTQGDAASAITFTTRADAANYAERMRIDTAGKIGIGVSPSYMLHVQGNLSSSQSLFYNTINAGTEGNILLRLGSNCSNTNSTYLSGGIFGVADKFYIYGNGNMVNANNSYGLLSDVKLKENIVDATPKLEDILKVRIVNYNLISDPEQKQIGVIAQELEKIFPGLIDEHLDKDFEGNLLGTTTKMVKMSIFVPMLIKAMQEQQEQIEELKALINK